MAAERGVVDEVFDEWIKRVSEHAQGSRALAEALKHLREAGGLKSQDALLQAYKAHPPT